MDTLPLLESIARLAAGLATLLIGAALPRPTARVVLRAAPATIARLIIAWILLALLCHHVLGVTPLVALVAGAALAPSDPLLTRTFLRGRGGRSLSAAARDAIAARAAAADLLILPLALLPAALMGAALDGWIVREVLWASAGGALLGALAGWAAARLPQPVAWFLAAALTLLVLPALGCDGFIAAFTAGLMLHGRVRPVDHSAMSVLSLLAMLLLVVLYVSGPWANAWVAWGGAALLMAIAALLLKLALAFLTPARSARSPDWRGRLRQAALAPAGASALLYAAVAAARVGDGEVLAVAGLAVLPAALLGGIVAFTPRGRPAAPARPPAAPE